MAEILQFSGLALADLLTSDVLGQELTQALRTRFGQVTRPDVFLALRLARSIWEADLIEARLERDAARAELAAALLDLDAAQIRLRYLEHQVEVMHGRGAWLSIAAMSDPAMQEAAHG
jgi:hypothetical protein